MVALAGTFNERKDFSWAPFFWFWGFFWIIITIYMWNAHWTTHSVEDSSGKLVFTKKWVEQHVQFWWKCILTTNQPHRVAVYHRHVLLTARTPCFPVPLRSGMSWSCPASQGIITFACQLNRAHPPPGSKRGWVSPLAKQTKFLTKIISMTGHTCGFFCGF